MMPMFTWNFDLNLSNGILSYIHLVGYVDRYYHAYFTDEEMPLVILSD